MVTLHFYNHKIDIYLLHLGGVIMNPLIRKIVNYKLNQLKSKEELIKLAQGYQISLTNEEAGKILSLMKKETIDIGDENQINRLLKQVGKEINKDTEKKLRKLFQSI